MSTASAGFGASAYTPILVTTDTCSFYHPEDRISDHFQNGDEVHVHLADRFEYSDYTEPQMTRWALIAFACSESQSDIREEAVRVEMFVEEEVEEEEKKDVADEEMEVAEDAIKQEKAALMQQMLRSQMPDPNEVESLCDIDWHYMTKSKFIEKWEPNKQNQSMLRETLKHHYYPLTEIFKMFAATSSGYGTSHLMDFLEFLEMVTSIKFFAKIPYPRLKRLLRVTFHASFTDEPTTAVNTSIPDASLAHGRSKYSTQDSLGLSQSGFFNAMIKLSIMKYIDCVGLQSSAAVAAAEYDREEGKEHRKAMSIVRTIPEAFDMFMNNDIRPYIDRSSMSMTVHSAFTQPEIMVYFYENKEMLYEIYHSYCPYDSPSHLEECDCTKGFMTLNEFVLLVGDARLMGQISGRKDELTETEVRVAFAAAQSLICNISDDQGNVSEKMIFRSIHTTSTMHHRELMSFAEFIEATIRVGLLKWEDEDIPLFEKIKMTVENIENHAVRGHFMKHTLKAASHVSHVAVSHPSQDSAMACRRLGKFK